MNTSSPTIRITLISVLFFLSWGTAHARRGAGVEPALNLIRMDAPRPSALGEAYTAAADDIAALNFNPASLGTLTMSHALFHYNQGAFGDTMGRVAMGFKMNRGALGVVAGRYDAGEATLYDGMNAPKSVTAQSDTLVNLAYGQWMGPVAVGGNIKFLRSVLAEQSSANAGMLDVGIHMPVTSRLRVGVAGPIYTSRIRYDSTSEQLPRVLRAGAAYQTHLRTGDASSVPVLLLADAPYSMGEKTLNPALGAEVVFGMLSVRGGYRWGARLNGFSIGTGMALNNIALDYSFGFVNENQVSHIQKISLSYRQ